MSADVFFEKIVEFFDSVGTVLIFVWNYICIFFKFAGEAIGAWIQKTIPILPPISKFLGIKKLSLTLLVIILLYIIIINIYAFHLYSSDKERAKKRKEERISEYRLLKVAFLGGSLGSFVAMRAKHHKTLKKKFTVTVTVLLVVQTLICSSLIGFFGFWIYLS